jgi:hypothetical protein
VEGKFLLRGIANELSWFYNCLQVLFEATVILIADLMEAHLLPENLYKTLEARLMVAY